MRNILLSGVFLLTAFSCKKSHESSANETPATDVPAPLYGINWHLGNVVTFFSANFWADQRSYVVGNTANGQRYSFTKDGHYEFYNYYASNAGCGLIQRYTYHKGTVAFEGDQFIIYPVEGRRKLASDCASGDNYDRNMTSTEKTDAKKAYKWQLKTGPAGDKILTLLDLSAATNAPVEYVIKP